MVTLAVALIGSYLVGSFPTGYLLVKRLKRVDVRSVGSGNVGATNVTRVAGAWAGRAVFLMDVAKGLIAVLGLAPWLVHPVSPTAQLACGLAAVVGHAFPVFLKFQGGKGVATTIGVLIGAMPAVAGVSLVVWISCFAIWRYVSVGSLAAAAAIPIAQMVTRRPPAELLLGAALALLIVVRHRANIERLLEGREHRFAKRAGSS